TSDYEQIRARSISRHTYRCHTGSQLHIISGFLFSSRRRHTRSKRDWSSDVCSSDLADTAAAEGALESGRLIFVAAQGLDHIYPEIGRASCRERAYISVIAVSLDENRAEVLPSGLENSSGAAQVA